MMVLTFIFMQVTYGLLVGEDDGLVLSNDLPPEVFPTWRQLTQLLQLTHPACTKHISERCTHDLTVKLVQLRLEHCQTSITRYHKENGHNGSWSCNSEVARFFDHTMKIQSSWYRAASY